MCERHSYDAVHRNASAYGSNHLRYKLASFACAG
jgi:hypothetical protein